MVIWFRSAIWIRQDSEEKRELGIFRRFLKKLIINWL